MAKKQKPAKPLFPLKHEFYASLDQYTHEAGMLRDVVDQLLKMGAIPPGSAAVMLRERVVAFDKIRFGDDN